MFRIVNTLKIDRKKVSKAIKDVFENSLTIIVFRDYFWPSNSIYQSDKKKVFEHTLWDRSLWTKLQFSIIFFRHETKYPVINVIYILANIRSRGNKPEKKQKAANHSRMF